MFLFRYVGASLKNFYEENEDYFFRTGLGNTKKYTKMTAKYPNLVIFLDPLTSQKPQSFDKIRIILSLDAH